MYLFTLQVMTEDYAQMLFSHIPFSDLNTPMAEENVYSSVDDQKSYF